MNQPASGPPNPRHARYRQVPMHWSGCPITVTLIVLCCIVAAVSGLGDHSHRVAWLFFAEQPHYELLEKLEEQLAAIDEAGDEEESEEYQRVLEEYHQIVQTEPEPFGEIRQGQVWRLATPMFLHFGPMHLLFNMMWLWTLGRPLEFLLRGKRFLLIILSIAILSNTVEAMVGGTNFGGMSGVIYGLFGYYVMHRKLNPVSSLYIEPQTVRFMMIWLVVCFTGLFGPIANYAHTAGLLAGGAIGSVNAMRNGGLKALRRRQEFRRAIIAGSTAIHRCGVCGKTEEHDDALEFRVCEDGQEYCEHHLPKATASSAH
jgi:membrane associated rhomboid family serine protease